MKKVYVMAVIFLFASINSSANWSNWGGGNIGTGVIRTAENSQVEMRSMKLDIELYRSYAKVRVEYEMHNTGDSVVVKGAFPCMVYPQYDDREIGSSKIVYRREIEDYLLAVDGKEIPYKEIKGEPIEWLELPDYHEASYTEASVRYDWFLSEVPFKKNETKKFLIAYCSVYQYSGGGWSSQNIEYDSDYFRYILSPGASWKGPIEKGQINIRASSISPEQITIKPEGRFTLSDDTFSWEFEDLEPALKDNLEICFNNAFKEYIQTTSSCPNAYVFYRKKYFLDFRNYSEKASSTRPEMSVRGKRIGYHVDNISDCKDETAWVEGVEGPGIGESITLTLSKPMRVSQIGIIPGYAKSKRLYFANNRVAEMKIIINGKHTVVGKLDDEYIYFGGDSPKGYQWMDLGQYPEIVETIQLVINKVYSGRVDDTCISEIVLRKEMDEEPRKRRARK